MELQLWFVSQRLVNKWGSRRVVRTASMLVQTMAKSMADQRVWRRVVRTVEMLEVLMADK